MLTSFAEAGSNCRAAPRPRQQPRHLACGTEPVSDRELVDVRDLKLGMYVVDLDRPWMDMPFEPPFELQGFTIRSDDEISTLKRYCNFVYIDPDLSTPVSRVTPRRQGASLAVHPAAFYTDLPEPHYKDVHSVEQELPRAQEIVTDADGVYDKVLDDIRSGARFDARAVRESVTSLVDSVLRNPDAAQWLMQLKHRDAYTYLHSMEVCILSLALGRHIGLPRADLATLGMATLLQDIGKLRVPESLLRKREPLLLWERDALRKHVQESASMLRDNGGVMEPVIDIVVQHHERFNGSGYPRGLHGTQVSPMGYIAGICDTYRAMTTERPYRAALTSFDALMRLYESRDQEFPAALTEHFIQSVGIFSVGSFVMLNTGEVGVVVERHRIHQLKPRVLVLLGSDGAKLDAPATMDLAADPRDGDGAPKRVARVVDPADYGLDRREFFV